MEELFLDGYDHILDLEDSDSRNILMIAEDKRHKKTCTFLKEANDFEVAMI